VADLDGPAAAILAETPVSPEDGHTVVSYDMEPDGGWWPIYGPPTPVAARQAANLLRWLADDLDAKADAINPNPRYRPSIHIAPSGLRQLADKIASDNGNHGR